VVDPSDIFVAYSKYVGKAIEIRGVQCYYADKDDYRCVTGKHVTFFTEDIEPQAAREAVGEIKKALTSSACSKTIRLTAEDISDDVISGNQTRVTVNSNSLEVVAAAPVTKRTKKRR
jgi:hypothetical protein